MNICVSCKHSCYTVDDYYIKETEHMCMKAKKKKISKFLIYFKWSNQTEISAAHTVCYASCGGNANTADKTSLLIGNNAGLFMLH